ncbi:MAG: GNAT family N-acetyltransferase [Bacteroidota bacterium]
MKNLKIHIKRIENTSEIPYDLLALADPSRSMINKYLKTGLCYLAKSGRKVVGVLVLNKIDKTRIEVKNIAIAEGEQGKGFGKALLEFCESVSRELGFDTLVIGTGNSSLDQLALYQKVGFEMFKIQKDFFIKNYSEPIFENGIQCKHMVILEKELRRSYHNKSHSL